MQKIKTMREFLLARVCSIKNHPIYKLEEKFKVKYIEGIGACLYHLSQNSPITKVFFKTWAQNILNKDIDIEKVWRKDEDKIKETIKIQWKTITFFSMKYSFLFDCYYLLISSFPENKELIQEQIFEYFDKNICGYFTKGALKYIDNYFDGKHNDSVNKINPILKKHREDNNKNLKQKFNKILVVANVSAGKSTLINALVGYRINRAKNTVCTNKIVKIFNKHNEDGITIIDDKNNYSYYDDIESVNSDDFISASFPFNTSIQSSNICYIDTPGVNNSQDSRHIEITESIINNKNDYDGVLYVSNAQYFGTNDELYILKYLYEKVKKPIIFVLNQVDKFKEKEDSINKMLSDYKQLLESVGFKKPLIVPVSARAALLFKLSDNVLDEEDLFEKEQLKQKFEKDYYKISSYTGNMTEDALSNTGIIMLENSIENHFVKNSMIKSIVEQILLYK